MAYREFILQDNNNYFHESLSLAYCAGKICGCISLGASFN